MPGMTWGKAAKLGCLLASFCAAGAVFQGSPETAWATPQLASAARSQVSIPANIPDDVQLLNADANPTLRFPVGHSSLSWTLIKPRVKASYGFLEIDRTTVRYTVSRPSRTKEVDQSFQMMRGEMFDLKFEYNAAEFRARGLRQWFAYEAESHWDAADSLDPSVNSITKVDAVYTPLILEALQNFDSVVEKVKQKQQQAAPPPVAPQPVAPQPVEPAPAKQPPAPAPPTLILIAPSVTAQNQTVEVSESPLTVRGVVMDDSGLPTIRINGTPASLRPKGQNAAEFWSDPIELKPGDNSLEIVATSPTKADLQFPFVAHFTPKAAPINPRALGKAEIIALLQGGVPESHVLELVRDRGVKFAPTASDLNDLRAAGGSDELVQAIQQAAPGAK